MEKDHNKIEFLEEYFQKVDRRIKQINVEDLIPAHGDAHFRNLIYGPKGWVWIDFEDASLMPPYWDLASALFRTYLYDESREISTHLINEFLVNEQSMESFELALSARTVASMVFNMLYSLEHQYDSAEIDLLIDRGYELLDEMLLK